MDRTMKLKSLLDISGFIKLQANSSPFLLTYV